MQLEGSEIGNYRIISQIGYGASGYVYLAEDPRIQQRVALKVIQIEPGGDLTQFRTEALIVAQLKHPHIVHLNAYDEAAIDEMPIIYFVTPYYKDGSLAQWLQQRGTNRLPADDVLSLIGQGAEALQYAHQFQVVHSDVKPSNFLIDSEGISNPHRPNLLLTDFGVARSAASSPTRAGLSYPGGLTYTSPEQLSIGQSSFASDQYSLAIIAYELLTGEPPFLGAPQHVIRQHLEALPAAPSTKNSSIPKSIDDVILRALAKKPDDRWGSVEAFSTALQRKGGVGEPPRKPPFTPPNDPPGMPGASQNPNPTPPPPPPNPQWRGKDVSATLLVSPAEAQVGAVKQFIARGKIVPVQVPPNTYNGMVIHIDGLGEPSPSGGQPGTLHLTVNIAPQPYQSPPPGQPNPPRGYQAPPPPPASAYRNPPGNIMMPPGQHNPNRTLWIVLAIIAIVIVFFICVAASHGGY